MTSHTTMSPILRNLLTAADAMAVAHGLPLEVTILHLCAMGAALAGDLVTSNPEGGPSIPAKFSVVFRTRDFSAPSWLADEWAYLERRQEELNRLPGSPLASPQAIAALRRETRAFDFVTQGTGEGPGIASALLDLSKNRKSFRHIQRVRGVGRPKCSIPHGSTTFVAEGLSPLATIVGSYFRANGYWSRLTTAVADRSTVLGWVGSNDSPKYHQIVRPTGIATLGWLVACPASQLSHYDVAPKLLAETTLQRLELARFGSTRFPFEPPQPAKELLDRQVGRLQEIIAPCAPGGGKWLAPDEFLGWHLSSILAALCCDSRGEEFNVSLHQATRVGCAVAAWVFRQHVHLCRLAYPSDDAGWFKGQDLAIFRLLTSRPASVRDVQRRLRGVNKDTCLRVLRRAVRAGLVVETDVRHFGLRHLPSVSSELSDFLSEFDPNSIFPIRRR